MPPPTTTAPSHPPPFTLLTHLPPPRSINIHCSHFQPSQYLPTFNKPNVTLVDTDGKGVERITPNGIVVAGKEHELDCIIMATGFETGYSAEELGPQKAGFELVGRHGLKLSDKWAKGPRTLNSFSTHGFPNLFMQNAPQGTLTTNFVHTLDEVAQHAAFVIGSMREKGYRTFDPSKAAEDAYCQRIFDRSHKGKKFLEGCTPGVCYTAWCRGTHTIPTTKLLQ